jgi:hypothetical protein
MIFKIMSLKVPKFSWVKAPSGAENIFYDPLRTKEKANHSILLSRKVQTT